MYYLSLTLLYTTVISKSFEIISMIILTFIVGLFFLNKLINIQLLLETNTSYEINLEFIYLLANIAINSVFLIQVSFIIVLSLTIYRVSYLINQNVKYFLIFFESVMFYAMYNYNIFYILYKKYSFSLHENIISMIHPFITISTLILILLYYKKKNLKEQYKSLQIYYTIIATMLLGSVWAASTEGWGGTWVWDPTESILLLFALVLLLTMHVKKNTHIKELIIYWVIPILFCYYQINKLSLVSGIHNFYTNQLSSTTFYTILIGSMVGLLYVTINKVLYKMLSIYIVTEINILIFFISIIFYLKNYEIINNTYTINIAYNQLLLLILFSWVYFYNTNKTLYIITYSIIIIVYMASLELLPLNKLIIICLCAIIISTTLWTKSSWDVFNHKIHLYICIFVLCNYIEFKKIPGLEINFLIQENYFQNTFNIFIFQDMLYNEIYVYKESINSNSFFLSEITKNKISSENTKLIINHTLTNLINFSTLILNTKVTELLNFSSNNMEINLYTHKLIFISFWILIYAYLFNKW